MALVDNKAKIQALIAGINALPNKGEGEGETLQPVLQEKTATPTKEAQSITPDTGYDGLSAVNVEAIPDEYIVPSGTVDITANGTHDVREAESVIVNVPAPEVSLQEKTVTPSEIAQTVEADGGYDGLSKVTVEQIPSDYVIPTGEKSITANGIHDVAGFASVNVAVEGGGSGVTNVDTCSFLAGKEGLPVGYNGVVECCWTEFYEGVFEYCQDSGENMSVSGMPVCNTVLGVWWSNYSGYTSSVEVNGAEIIHKTASSATILMPAEAGSSVQVMVIYSR